MKKPEELAREYANAHVVDALKGSTYHEAVIEDHLSGIHAGIALAVEALKYETSDEHFMIQQRLYDSGTWLERRFPKPESEKESMK